MQDEPKLAIMTPALVFVTCPYCDTDLDTPLGPSWDGADLAPLYASGRRKRCPHCRATFRLPLPNPVTRRVANHEPDREALGRVVRDAWCRWAVQQTPPRNHDPWEALPEAIQEVDRQIGEAVARAVLYGEPGPPARVLPRILSITAEDGTAGDT